MGWKRSGLLVLATLAGTSPAWGKPCVIVGFEEASEITLPGGATQSVPPDEMSQLAECDNVKVKMGKVCLMTETACEQRVAVSDLMSEKSVGSAANVAGILKVLLAGFTATNQGLTRSHDDSATLPGFPYAKVLAPPDGQLVIPLGPAGGGATNFTLAQDRKVITQVPSARDAIVVDARGLARETLYTWTVTVGGRPYTGQFYVMSDEKSQLARGAADNVVTTADTTVATGKLPPSAERVLRSVALQKRGLGLDATLTLVTANP